MSREDRVLSVDEKSDKELEETVRRLRSIPSNETVSLDSTWEEGQNFQEAQPSACAVLIQKQSGHGAVRVYSDPVTNVVTGPKQNPGVSLVILREGEGCRLLGNPSVRWVIRTKNESN